MLHLALFGMLHNNGYVTLRSTISRPFSMLEKGKWERERRVKGLHYNVKISLFFPSPLLNFIFSIIEKSLEI
jgi:predicted transcriptional regulator